MEDRKGKGITMESGSINNSDEEFLNAIPLGFRFRPTDEELVDEYLKKKVANEPLHPNMIRVVNVYKFHPHSLFDMYNLPRDEALYVFTKTEKKHTNGKRTNRVIPNGIGYWKGRQSDKRVLDNNGNVIWSRVSLVFQEGKSKGSVKTNWLMQEYRVGDGDKLDEWVICKIYLHMNKNERAIQLNDGAQNAAALSVVASPLQEVAYNLAERSLANRTLPSYDLGMCTDGPFYSRVQPNAVDSSDSMLAPIQASFGEKSYEEIPFGEMQNNSYDSNHFTSTMGYPLAADSGSMPAPLQVSFCGKSYEETPLVDANTQNIGGYDSNNFTSTMGYLSQPLDSIMCTEGPFNGQVQPNATDSGSMLASLQVSIGEKIYEENPLGVTETQNIGVYDSYDSNHFTSTMGYPPQPLHSIMFSNMQATEGGLGGIHYGQSDDSMQATEVGLGGIHYGQSDDYIYNMMVNESFFQGGANP